MELNSRELNNLNVSFRSRADIPAIFDQPHLGNSIESKVVVGGMWFKFSQFMPKFLNIAASKISSTIEKNRIKEIAFEEMGEGFPQKRHSETFMNAILEQFIDKEEWRDKIVKLGDEVKYLLKKLEVSLNNSPSEHFVTGMCLGMEIPANENIEKLFQSVNYGSDRSTLEASDFFSIHRVNEDEHIAKNLKNYSNAVSSNNEEPFLDGFDRAIVFWKEFWALASRKTEEQLHVSKE